jgi:predicted permease
LIQQLVTESFVISLGGGALGLLFSHWTAGAFPSFFTPEQAQLLDPRLDVRVFLFTLSLSILAGCLFGLAPAVLATKPVVTAAMRSDPGGAPGAEGGVRLRAGLVTAQIALSIVLLIATLQLVRSLEATLGNEMSDTARHVAVASLILPGRYVDQARGIRYQRTAVEDLLGKSGIESVAWISTLPLFRANEGSFQIDYEGGSTEYAELQVAIASIDYFQTMGIPTVAGRAFDARDGALADSVVVVNDVLAVRYFGSVERAVGRHLRDAQETPREIVGVVRAGKYRTLQPPSQPMLYYPTTQAFVAGLNLTVRSSTDPSRLLEMIRTILESADPKVEIQRVATLDTLLSEALALEKLTTALVATCGFLTLVLAIVGVYGVMADAVRRRARELGVRVALGARPIQIVQLVLAYGAKLAAAGAALGILGALIGIRLLHQLLNETPPLGRTTFAIAPIVLTVLVLAAAVVPVIRALRVSPTVALRQE